MGARNEKTQNHDPSPTGDAERAAPRLAAPQLAEGTACNVDAQSTKGICFATECHTVDQFVSTFRRYCEASAIFMPAGSRPVGTSLAFSFELANDESVLLGVGTALVYPALLAAIGDRADPRWRASAVGVYRFWRDMGYAVGAVLSGVLADWLGIGSAIAVIGFLTFASGLIVALRMIEE